ncbi:MAG: HEAT repeat domain-containing protein [Candidatus Heimdallarchaeota archaeon]|nr:MAG: HEAT repeat domain-containing protein [Candidatus Heimdallarchaeota archaeon]
MIDFPDLNTIRSILIRTINEDPDLHIKALIASHLAQRDSSSIIQRLLELSKSHSPEVREIIAISLDGHSEVLTALLDWFEVEKDLTTLEKLFITLSTILKNTSDSPLVFSTAARLNSLIQKEDYLQKALELIGYCDVPLTEQTFLKALHTYRFNEKIRVSIIQGILHLAKKTHSLPIEIQNHLITLVSTSYEPPKLRELGLNALGEVKNQEVIDALELIIETDHNPHIRKKAIEIIGKWGIIELSPLLIEKLRYDGISDVRTAAATMLGAMSCFDAVPELSEALSSDPSFFVREASAEALGLLKSQQALLALLKGLEDQDSYVRATSAWSIEQLQPTSDLIQKICQAARSVELEAKIRRGMVSLLGRMSSIEPTNKEAIRCLLTLFLKDRTPLRELVMEALENFTPQLAVERDLLEKHLPFILETLTTSQSFSLRAAICSFLGHLKESTTFPFLLDRLLNDEDAFVQRQAAWAISNLNPSEHTTHIHDLLQNKRHSDKVPLLLEILTSWIDLDDLPLALKYLSSHDIEWRRRTVEWITAIIDTTDLGGNLELQVINKLISLLEGDKANTVRAAAAHALGHFPGVEFDDVINPALLHAIKTDRIYSVRELAAEALGFRGGISSVPELINLIQYEQEKDPSIRYFSSLALLNVEAQLSKKNN